MAKLYFRYGVMGSSKTANALMVRYNYEERGQDALLVKPAVDQRDGARFVASRAGLSHPCIYFSDLMEMTPRQLKPYACIIVDEAQFLTRDEVRYLTDLVDDWNIPVICYGLRTDFKGELFPGSAELLATADVIEEVKTICWCGKKALCKPALTRAATSSRRASRWCWGQRQVHRPVPQALERGQLRAAVTPGPCTPRPAGSPAATPRRRRTVRGPARGCPAAPPASAGVRMADEILIEFFHRRGHENHLLTSFKSSS